MWFFPQFLMPPKEWISELTWVKTPGKTETRLFLTWICSPTWFTVLLHKQRSWGCGARGNELGWGSREAGNLSDSAVIKVHVSWYSACHEAAVEIWNPSCCKKLFFFFLVRCWNGWLPHCRGHRWHMHVPITLRTHTMAEEMQHHQWSFRDFSFECLVH